MIRDPVIRALLIDTALFTDSTGTISTTMDRRAGLSSAVRTPPMNASTKIAGIDGSSLNATSANSNDCTIAAD